MREITGLIGRGDVLSAALKELRKGKHVILFGPVGVGKSAILHELALKFERRAAERRQLEPLEESTTATKPAAPAVERRRNTKKTLIYIHDHQAKAQFVTIARRMLENGLVKPSDLDLPEKLDDIPFKDLDWAKLKRTVGRLSMKDITDAILPALHDHKGKVVICVDDMTSLTPTQQAFWLSVFEQAQVVACASAKKDGLRKLWWKMREVQVKPLQHEAATALVERYIAAKGIMIESPDLYIGHVVKQAGGNPQAIADMLNDSKKEKVVSKKKIREMRHQAGVRYVNFTPILVVMGGLIMASRYTAIGTGDRALYVMAGIGMALFLVVKYFMPSGRGAAT